MFVFETRYAPLYLQAFPPTFEYEEARAHFDEVEAHFRSLPLDAHAALIADSSSVLKVDARTRRRVAESFERMSPLMEKRAVAHAIVLNNAVVRHALTGIFWLARPPWTIKTFARIELADVWVRSQFVPRGLPEVSAPPDWWREGVMQKLVVRRSA